MTRAINEPSNLRGADPVSRANKTKKKMKHRIKHRKLGRGVKHRIAMLKNMSKSLLEHERLRTTVARAKELRPFVEKLITLGKRGTLGSKREAKRFIINDEVRGKMLGELATRYAARQGGYTRVCKVGFRGPDKADMAVIELVARTGEIKEAKPPQTPVPSGTRYLSAKEKLAELVRKRGPPKGLESLLNEEASGREGKRQ